MTDPKKFQGGGVASWRNTLDKSKQKHNAPGYIYLLPTMTNPEKFLWCRGCMVAPWKNTLASRSRSI